MNSRRVGDLVIAWDQDALPFDAFGAALPLELTVGSDPEAPPPDARIVVHAQLVSAPRPSPAQRGASSVLYHGRTRCLLGPTGLELWDGASLLRVAEDGTRVDAEVHPSSLTDPFLFASETVTMALLLTLRIHGYFHLHACGAVWPGGARWLLPAESNAGKSTLGLAMFTQGAHWLSDDALLLRRVGSEIETVGWPRPMRMTTRTAAAFPELRPLLTPCPPSSARDFQVDPRIAFRGRGERAVRGPFTLVFPRIGQRVESRIVPLDRAQAFGHLLHACAWVASDHLPRRQEQLELLASVVDGGRAYDAAIGSRILDDPAAELRALRAQLD